MEKAYIVSVAYKTGGILEEDIAVVFKTTKPTQAQMRAIWASKSEKREQPAHMIHSFWANKIDVIRL